uniref:Uncharacterized protein n=1 Tax=Arundo donax TaxID=35708 RepID=A0A0A9BST8_ARUDO
MLLLSYSRKSLFLLFFCVFRYAMQSLLLVF